MWTKSRLRKQGGQGDLYWLDRVFPKSSPSEKGHRTSISTTEHMNCMPSLPVSQAKKNYGTAKYAKIVKIPHVEGGGSALFEW